MVEPATLNPKLNICKHGGPRGARGVRVQGLGCGGVQGVAFYGPTNPEPEA